MSEVKRYTRQEITAGMKRRDDNSLFLVPDGPFVPASNFDRLAAQNAELSGQLSLLIEDWIRERALRYSQTSHAKWSDALTRGEDMWRGSEIRRRLDALTPAAQENTNGHD